MVLSSSAKDDGLCWQPEHVLRVLQGKESTLQELTLKYFDLVCPRIALMLSGGFPKLQRLELSNCKRLLPQTGPGAGSKEQEEEALQQLRQLLRPGLELVVSHEL
jgi:hypothetical protein